MKIFAVHRGKDAEEIKQISDKIIDYRTGFLQLNSNDKHWHRSAKRMIEKADIVIYFVGNEFTENIDWEIKTANKLNKTIYLYKLSQCDQKIIDRFKHTDDYGLVKDKYKELSLQAIIDMKQKQEPSVSENLYNSGVSNGDYMLEQYKLMIETTESSIERRQKVSNTYITISSIFMPIISAMIASSDKWLNLSSIIVSLISIVLCCSWLNTIHSYGLTNSAKFEIIENIEKSLPLSMFRAEWYVRSARNKKIVSFTSREKNIPIIFIGVNIGFIALAIVLFCLRHFAII